MAKRPKKRETAQQILARLSERMFPAALGSAKVTLDSREADGDSVLHTLLYGREYYPAKTLIEAGADVNAVGDLGYTPLHVAVWRDHPDAVHLLLDAGADPKIRCEEGRTPLDIAQSSGLKDIARILSRS
ncbi:MAG: ankyrin repeat domain-containing protein [Pseudomonadota bacterium]